MVAAMQIAPVATIGLSLSYNFLDKENRAPKRGVSNDHAFKDFKPKLVTLPMLVKHIEAGGAFSVAALTTNHRHSENYASSQLIGVDFDSTSMEAALKIPFVQKHAFYVYPTASHEDNKPRSRALFVLSESVKDVDHYKRLVAGLLAYIELVDKACGDAARIFFGSRQAIRGVFRPELVLPLDLLEVLAKYEAPAVPKLSLKSERSKVWEMKAKQQIAAKLQRTGKEYRDGAIQVHCPCGQHTNGDAHPSGGWYADSGYLYCFKTRKSFSLKETAKLLGIQLERIGLDARGLDTASRETLLAAKKGSFCRFLDAWRMNGYEGGSWHSVDEILTKLSGVSFDSKTVRYSIGKLLFNSRQYAEFAAKSGTANSVEVMMDLGQEEVFSAVGAIHSFRNIPKSNMDNNGKKVLVVQAPPEQPKGRKPKTLYFIPSEQNLAAALGITLMGYSDNLPLVALQSEAAYCQALNSALIERQAGKYRNRYLAKRLGKSKRTINRYIKADNRIEVIPHTIKLGTISKEIESQALAAIPSMDETSDYAKSMMRSRFLEVVNPNTGEIIPYGYTRENAKKLLRYHQEIKVCTWDANEYRMKQEAIG